MPYSWQNEDGEPIMDGAAWRFEQALDSERDLIDDYYDDRDAEPPPGYTHFYTLDQRANDDDEWPVVVDVEVEDRTVARDLPYAAAVAQYGNCDIN